MSSLVRRVSNPLKTLLGTHLPLGTAIGLVLISTIGASPASARSEASRASVLFVARGGSDAGQCSKAAPCASFARAYKLAAPGAVVEVSGGSYPRQILTIDAAKRRGAHVIFRPAAGASVTLAEFVSGDTAKKIGARRFELRDMKVSSYVRVRWGSEDVTLRNIDAGGLALTSASRVKVLGGDYGPMLDGVSHINACGVPGCFPAEDILIDGALFHDYRVSDPAKHSECLMIWPGRRVTVRNSTFRNCTDFDVLVKPYNTSLVGSPANITFENNFFDEPIIGDECRCNRGGNAIAITQGGGEAWSGAQLRYNSSLGGIRIDPAITNALVKGNIARKDTNYSCQTNITFSYNLWSGAQCSRTDHRAGLSGVFVDSSSRGFDLDLRRRSPAIGAGDPDSAPRTDIDGRARPRSLAPDAGASQREPALVRSGRSIGNARIAMLRAAVLEWYGAPRRRTFAEGTRGQRLQVDSHAVRGGWLHVHYAGARVAALSTTSSYYRTGGNVGPGVRLRKGRKEKGECRRVGRSGLYLRATGGARPRVAELIVTSAGYTPACAGPRR